MSRFGFAMVGAVFVILVLCLAAFARDPDGRYAQSPLNEWFKSLKVPGTGGGSSCCSEADCKRTEATIEADHYRAALPTGEWVNVPPEIVIHDRGNPAGEPILCALPQGGNTYKLLCFVPGAAF